MFVGSSWQYSGAHKMNPQLASLCLHVYHVPNYCKAFDKPVVTVQVDVGVSVNGTALR